MIPKPNQRLDGLPGTRGFPLVGDVLRMLPDPLPFISSLHRQHGNVFYAHFALNRKNVLLLGPDAMEQVLVTDADKFSNELGYAELSDFLGKRTVLFQDGEAHKRLRQALNPAFKPENLNKYLRSAAAEIDGQLARWATSSSNLVSDVNLMTLRIASGSIIGASVAQEANVINANFLKVLNAMVTLVPDLPGSPKRQGLAGRLAVDKFFRGRIAKCRAEPGNNVFSQLCARDVNLTDDDIVDNMVGILFASYETTASTIATMMYSLACHPEWQALLREELQPLTREDGLSLEAVQQCQQTDWVFKETLRLYTPLAFFPRRTLQAVDVQGYSLPPDTAVTLAPRFVHHMASIYPNPERFDPARFSPARAEDHAHRYAWMPFGKGAHTCIGLHFARMEVFAFFARLLRKYRLEHTHGKFTLAHVPVLKPSGNIPVKLTAIT